LRLAGRCGLPLAGGIHGRQLSVASHCPKQESTARRLAEHLARLPRREATVRYLTNTGGRATTSAETVLDDLAQAVAQSVRWYDAFQTDGRARRHLRHRGPAGSRPHPAPVRSCGGRNLTAGQRPCGCRWEGPNPLASEVNVTAEADDANLRRGRWHVSCRDDSVRLRLARGPAHCPVDSLLTEELPRACRARPVADELPRQLESATFATADSAATG